MKTSENKAFGLIGIRVELTWIETMAISELVNELSNDQPYGHKVMSPTVEKAINFLSRLSIKQVGEDMRRAEEDLFGPFSMLPVAEDLKNECDLNALENETHQ